MTVSYRLSDWQDNQTASAPIIFPLGVPSAATTPAAYSPQQTQPDIFSDYELYNFPDWDGCGAQPILPETVAAARRLLRLLPRSAAATAEIAAGADGTIGFEWSTGSGPDRLIKYIEVGPGHTVRAITYVAGRATGRWPTRPLAFGVYNFLPALFPYHEST